MTTTPTTLSTPRMDYVWTHKEKGGEYRITSFTTGSGELHGQVLVHYRQVAAGGVGPVYSRRLDEWHEKMEPLVV